MGKTNSSNFGIYRDRDSRRRHHHERCKATVSQNGGSKVCLILSCTAGILLIVSLLALSVVVGKGRKLTDLRRMGFREMKVQDQGGIVTVSKENASSRDLHVLSEEFFSTSKELENTDSKSVARTSRAMDSTAKSGVQMYRARAPSNVRSTRFFFPPWSASTMVTANGAEDGKIKPESEFGRIVGHDHVAMPSVTQYGDQYAQLESYKHQAAMPQSIHKIINYEMADPLGTRHIPRVKIMGVYVKGPMEIDDPTGVSPYNGHAYTPDPFKYYKPAHPSEINHLATYPPKQDNAFRFSNHGVRPTRFPLRSSTPTVKGLTKAIFHPYDTVALNVLHANPTTTSQPSTTHSSRPNQRPLKIMLDIYPVHRGTESSEYEYSTQKKILSSSTPVVPPNSQAPGGGRMIVHLNLFPKKYKKKIPTNTGPPSSSSEAGMTLVPGGGYSFLRDLHDRKFVESASNGKNNTTKWFPTDETATTEPSLPTTAAPGVESGSIHSRPYSDFTSTDTEPNLLSTNINDELGGIIPRNAVEDYKLSAEGGEGSIRNSTEQPSIIDTGLPTETSTFVDDSLRQDLFNLQGTASSIDSSVDFEQEYLSSYETSLDAPA